MTSSSAGPDGRVLVLIGAVAFGLFLFLYALVKEIPDAALVGASPGLLVAIAMGACAVTAALALGPIGRALAGRIAGRGEETPQGDIDQLRAEIDETRRELGEAHERIDFTERLLTEARRQENSGGK